MLNKQVKLKIDENSEWSCKIVNFFNRLIQRKPENRLGFHGPEELKQHKFLQNFNWESLYSKQMKSPFTIDEDNNFDYEHVMKKWEPVQKKSQLIAI